MKPSELFDKFGSAVSMIGVVAAMVDVTSIVDFEVALAAGVVVGSGGVVVGSGEVVPIVTDCVAVDKSTPPAGWTGRST